MDTLFEQSTHQALKSRIESINAKSAPLWGKMNAPQMFAHCRRCFAVATDGEPLKRTIPGYLFAWMVKKKMVESDAPFGKNSPTDPRLIKADANDLEAERSKLLNTLDAFVSLGPSGMPDGPHPFFGKMSPEQWDRLMHKHLDHHLRQFGA